MDWIRAVAPNARRVVSVCTGAFLAAQAGLLDGCRATTHWAYAETLAREFPAVEVDPEPIFVRSSERVWTAAGVTAGIDLALALVEDDHGTTLAQTVARWLVLYLRRPGGQTQFAAPVWMPRARREPIREVQEAIEAEPGGGHTVAELARRAAMSPRHFTRVFTDQVGEAPAAYVERVRTEAARRQLEETDDTVVTIAARCGFGSAETMRRNFIRRIGVDSPDHVPHGRSPRKGTSMQIAIVLYPGFTALDFIGPYEVLRYLPDAEVRLVWHESGPITADSGILVVGATHSFAETPSPDLILIPGGFSTMEHARDEVLLEWVRRAHETAMWTTSVCSGSIILAAAGLLEGKRATSHWMALSALKALGVTAVGDQRIVVERDDEKGIVTAAGVSAGIDLALWLAGQIAGPDRAKVIQLSMEYDPQPPYDSGHTSKASATTKATAAVLMGRELANPTQLKAMSSLVWDHAIDAARQRLRRG